MRVQQQHIDWLKRLCNVNVTSTTLIQTLWSGYGECFRATLEHSSAQTSQLKLPTAVVVKCASPANATSHPRGWNNNTGHQRKLQSFIIEKAFYKYLQPLTSPQCYVPKHVASESKNGNTMLVMEDLATIGFSHCASSLSITQSETVLQWLAAFHAQFLVKRDAIHKNEVEVWQQGTYWHLATRMDELAAMPDCELKHKAHELDKALNNCSYQTLVHGDAKVANFCFTENFENCAAVDFQYVGYGVGIKDVAYFLGSALTTDEQTTYLPHLLTIYFETLKNALRNRNTQLENQASSTPAPYPVLALSENDIAEVEKQWRRLFSFACADFHRFLSGWSPGHWKIDRFLQEQTATALAQV